jgi:ribosome-associated protein
MYDDFENKKLIINYNSEWILLSDWHERTKLVDNQEQLFDILHAWKHSFSDIEMKEMKMHLWIDIHTCIKNILDHELEFQTARSWGHGWQNVNKVETKVQLFFNIQNSKYLDPDQKEQIITHTHQKQLHHDNSIIEFECQEERTQWKNKDKVIKEFIQFLNDALEEDRERIASTVPAHENEKRLKEKKEQWEKKSNRSFKPKID